MDQVFERMPSALRGNGPLLRHDTDAMLSSAERSVIFISRHDPLSSVPDRPGLMARIGRLLGAEVHSPLANSRLEVLRRVTIVLRHGLEPRDDMIDAFLDQGFTLDHLVLIREALRVEHPLPAVEARHALFWFVMTLVAVATFVVFEQLVSEPAISIVVAGLAFVTLASLTTPREPGRPL